jgi:ferritin-like protein
LANRSTFTSDLPRDIKRLIDLTPGNAHQTGELRRLFIDAHKHHRKWHSDMLSQKSNVDTSTEEPAETNAPIV